MIDKRHLHHVWTEVRDIKPWYFLAAAGVTGTVCVFALRANNEHMVKLRDAVFTADRTNGDVQGSLTTLQRYVTSHMNTGLSGGHNAVYPPIQLKYTYERLQQSSLQHGTNAELYTQAQTYCQQQNSTDFSGRNRVPCIEQYVLEHGSKPAAIPDSLYKFDFKAPLWSPDLAGWSLALTIGLLVAALATWRVDRWFIKRVQ